MTESYYIKECPNEKYSNEADVKSWNIGKIIFSQTDSTFINGYFKLDNTVISMITPGWYLIEFVSKDVDGEEIIDKKYIEIWDNTGNAGTLSYNLIKEENRTVDPGASLKIQTGSGADEVYVI